MKTKNLIIIGIQVAIVAGFGVSFVNYVKSEVNPVTVYEFTTKLTPGDKITSSDFAPIQKPAKAVNSNFVLNPNQILGQYVNTTVYPTEFVYQPELTSKGNLSPFTKMNFSRLRELTIPVNYISAVGGDLSRGDRVDLLYVGHGTKLATSNNSQGGSFYYSQVFMENVYVWQVNDSNGYLYPNHAGVLQGQTTGGQKISTNSTQGGTIASVTLLVSLNQAEQIETRLSTGSIDVVKRFANSTSYPTEGFVLGGNGYSKLYAQQAPVESGTPTIIPNNQYYQ